MAKTPEEALMEYEDSEEDTSEEDDKAIIREDMKTLGFSTPEQMNAFHRLVKLCSKMEPEDYSLEDEDSEDDEEFETFD